MKPSILLQTNLIVETHQLGQLMASYHGEHRSAVRLSWGFGLIAALLIAMVLSLGLIFGVNQTPGEVATLITGFTGLFFFSFLGLLVGIWFQLLSPRTILFYVEGFVSIRGSKIRVVRWDEVEIFQKAMGKPTFVESLWYVLRREPPSIPPIPFSLHTKDRATFRFGCTFHNLTQARTFTTVEEQFLAESELVNRMESEISIRVWEQTVAKYQMGHSIIFGRVQVSKQGIQIGSKAYLWHEIDNLVLSDALSEEEEEEVIREFSPSEAIPGMQEEMSSSRVPDLNMHLLYWQEEVSPSARILLRAKNQHQHTNVWQWDVSEMPNALVFVALIVYGLYQRY